MAAEFEPRRSDTRRRGVVRRPAALLLLTLLLPASARARADIIDRVLAVVDGTPITQSDVAAAARLGLIHAGAADSPSAAALDALIDRRLMLGEVDRYAPADPADSEVDAKLAEIRARAGAQFDAILAQTGIGLVQLRHQIRDDLRIESYLQQRFGAVLPSEEQILQYYREHAAEFPQAGFNAAHDAVRAALVADRRAVVIRDWLAGLRRRANINVLPA
jgi:hypothetical protein